MNQLKITQAVEAFCNMGCTSVNAIIHTLESGNIVEGIEDFSDDEASHKGHPTAQPRKIFLFNSTTWCIIVPALWEGYLTNIT